MYFGSLIPNLQGKSCLNHADWEFNSQFTKKIYADAMQIGNLIPTNKENLC